MRQFYKLIPYDPREELQFVADYDLGSFDHTILWKGRHITESILRHVKLFVTLGATADYVGNPLSWPICSSRLISALLATIQQDCEILTAPTVDKETGEPIREFRLVNVLRRVACLNLERSDVSYDEQHENRIFMIYKIALDEAKIDRNVHLFRLTEWPYAVIVSDEFADQLVGQQFRGLALEACYMCP